MGRHVGFALDHREHLSACVDHEGPTLDCDWAKSTLDSEAGRDYPAAVTKERKVQRTPLRKIQLLGNLISADPDHLSARLGKLTYEVLEVASLNTASPAAG